MYLKEFTDVFIESVKNTTRLEFVAVFFALLYVVLASQQNVLCWLSGLISVSIYIYICYQAQLYLETFLQIFYSFISIYGWYQWIYGSDSNQELSISSFQSRKIGLIVIIGIIVSVIVGYLFRHYTTTALPYLDAHITVFSVIATWLTAKKIIQNWIFWIVIDFAAIFLYSKKGLYLSGMLYFAYTLICIYGYRKWSRTLRI